MITITKIKGLSKRLANVIYLITGFRRKVFVLSVNVLPP